MKTNKFLVLIPQARLIISNMIENANAAGGEHNVLFAYQDALIQLEKSLKNGYAISSDLHEKWTILCGNAHRIFEGHPLLELLYDINAQIKLSQ